VNVIVFAIDELVVKKRGAEVGNDDDRDRWLLYTQGRMNIPYQG